MNIRKLQKCPYLNIPREAFSRLVREIGISIESNRYKKAKLRFSKEALLVLQYVSESYLITLLKRTNIIAIHNGKVTIQYSDLHKVNKILSSRSPRY